MATEDSSLVSDIRSQIGSFYEKLPISRRWLFLGIILTTILGLGLIVIISQQTTWVTLFSDLSDKETARVVKKLDESQIKYLIAPGGGGVLVPAELADQAKLEVANSDLLNGGLVGLEIFDNNSFTMTEFQQNVQLRRAMEGELGRLIQLINVVDSAKVVLALPERTVFIDNQRQPSAAVHLVIRDSSPLDSKMVKTILNLVASGVPGLMVEDVKISDQYGNLYTSSLQDSVYDAEDKNLQYKHNVESYLENKVLDQLHKITGREGVKVKISAQINNDVQMIDEDLVDPDLTAVVSEQSIQESAAGSRSIPIGVPGVTSNSPEINSSINETANIAESDKRTKQTNYENSRRRIRREINAGTIERLTISVLIDDKSILVTGDNGELNVQKEKWSTGDLDEIRLITQNAVGFSSQRGDSIEVKNLTFSTELEESIKATELSTQAQREVWFNIGKYLLVAAIALILLLLVIRPVLKSLVPASEDLEASLGLPTTVASLEGDESEAMLEVDDDDELGARAPTRGKILEMAKGNIDETVNTLRSWLREA